MYSLAGRQHDLLTRFEPMNFCWLPKFWTWPKPKSQIPAMQEYVGREIAEEEGRSVGFERVSTGRNGGDDKLTWNEACSQQKMTWPGVRDSKHAEFHHLSWCDRNLEISSKAPRWGKSLGFRPDVTWCRCLAEPGLAWDNVEIFHTAPCEFGQSNVWCFRAPLIRWHFW